MRLRQLGQSLQIGTLQIAPAPEVDHQALGHMGQQRPRLLAHGGAARRHHEPQEGVMRQIGRIAGIAEAPPQPGQQPGVVIVVQRFDG
ncbi:hypothetical protein D3C71_1991130 [compost metagenome]